MGKTVYVLGAGFSIPASLPPQKALLTDIFSLSDQEVGRRAGLFADRFLTLRASISEFLQKVFGAISQTSLEDIFTLLDLSVNRREWCGPFHWKALDEKREQLRVLIVFYLMSLERDYFSQGEGSIERITYRLLLDRLSDKDDDPIAVISLNWDDLFERSMTRVIDRMKKDSSIGIDYCCYTTPLRTPNHYSSITQKARGIVNFKIAKLHGSMNWVHCTNCERLFVNLSDIEDWINLFGDKLYCPSCAGSIVGGGEISPELEPFIVTPTYVKVFDTPHIRTVWHNAHVELSEASRIVFLGYSLPEADFQFRALLRRSITEGTRIDVVLVGNDFAEQGLSNEHLASGRFERFFNHFSDVRFHRNGVEGFFSKSLGTSLSSGKIGAASRALGRWQAIRQG